MHLRASPASPHTDMFSLNNLSYIQKFSHASCYFSLSILLFSLDSASQSSLHCIIDVSLLFAQEASLAASCAFLSGRGVQKVVNLKTQMILMREVDKLIHGRASLCSRTKTQGWMTWRSRNCGMRPRVNGSRLMSRPTDLARKASQRCSL